MSRNKKRNAETHQENIDMKKSTDLTTLMTLTDLTKPKRMTGLTRNFRGNV